MLITDREFSDVIAAALAAATVQAAGDRRGRSRSTSGPGDALGAIDYEALLADGRPRVRVEPPADEWDAISLNYTSGTTGNPKGVVYHHRGAYLNALGDDPRVGHAALSRSISGRVPMFHCNGWCFPWAIAALAGTNVCLRKVDAGDDLPT